MVHFQVRLDKSYSKHVGFARNFGLSMANRCPSLANTKYKYGSLMFVETWPNGGGKVLHMWHDDIKDLGEKEQEEIADEFLEV